MKSGWTRAAAAASALLALLALGACGDRVENDEMPLAELHPSVEINRQGMKGAADASQAQGVEHDTVAMGSAPDTESSR
ncbi:MAG TPA: hypothetical protein VFM98_12700 [Ramlibacter sp.]|uniref:hypothetical protein n=1 Tax=Ramlibacter sp. TaxID=1917967 RepID=UPI002D7E5E1A|nr:hypothetical protein [Ramlibacter sp.]HET8746459.1 hypothetical protein [Ramlibacter sp.]